MKYFYLIGNPRKKHVKENADFICHYLKEHGCVCYRPEESVEVPHRKTGYNYTDSSAIPDEVECIITLGGDGTLIQAARDLARRNLPLIGINFGTLGYLTQIGKEEEITWMLGELISDHFQLEKRMMLTGTAYHNGQRCCQDVALNDIVITRRDLLRVLKFRIYVNGEILNEYKADGMIIATPTGSTAYNLSAGGPIVVPTSSMIILTPICPHTLNSRSIVLSAEEDIKLEILGDNDKGQVVVFDGDSTAELSVGDVIEVQKSQMVTTLVKLKNISFLDNLRDKLSGI